jgi:uncharacterized protein (TIGR02996 family)
LSDEPAFLNTILENPEDDAPRLVYADWLDEAGDPVSVAKAAFLRATATLDLPGGRILRWRRLRQAARKLDDDWLAVVGKMPIEACQKTRCPGRWENLRPTTDCRVRSCGQCRKPVYYCATLLEGRDRVWEGRPVVVNLSVAKACPLSPPRGLPREIAKAELADFAIAEFERERYEDGKCG